MINLLPLAERKTLYSAYRVRLVVALLALALLTLIIAMIALSPSLFLITAKEESVARQVAVAGDALSVRQKEHVEERASRINTQIEALKEDDPHALPISPHIRRAIIAHPADVSVSGFFYRRDAIGGEVGGTMRIVGIAADRSTLLSFVERLRKDSLFRRVDLPVSNLVKNADIPFFIVAHFAPRQ